MVGGAHAVALNTIIRQPLAQREWLDLAKRASDRFRIDALHRSKSGHHLNTVILKLERSLLTTNERVGVKPAGRVADRRNARLLRSCDVTRSACTALNDTRQWLGTRSVDRVERIASDVRGRWRCAERPLLRRSDLHTQGFVALGRFRART